MKRLSMALAALGLSAGALAALPAATDPTVVTVPQLPGGFVIGVTGYYLEPSDTNGDLDYATLNSGTATSFSSSLQNVEPGYDWGWGVNLGYIFPNTGNDINLSYFNLSTSDTASSSIGAPAFTFLVGPRVLPINISNGSSLFDTDITSASSTADYDLDQIDLTLGQYLDVGCRLILHPNIGLRWAALERKLNGSYFAPGAVTNNFTANNGVLSTEEKSDFSGIGPLVGIDASYYIGMGFGAVAHADSALLVGDINSNTNLNVAETIVENPTQPGAIFIANDFSNSFSADNQQRIVPVVDLKLGADYTYVFNNAANSDLTLEAGWMFSNYFNAIDRLGVTSSASNVMVGMGAPLSVGSSVNSRTTSDLGLEGPYLSLVFHA